MVRLVEMNYGIVIGEGFSGNLVIEFIYRVSVFRSIFDFLFVIFVFCFTLVLHRVRLIIYLHCVCRENAIWVVISLCSLHLGGDIILFIDDIKRIHRKSEIKEIK